MCTDRLAPKVREVFEKVSMANCIKPYLLCGGTALSLQMANRQSEGLDFLMWGERGQRRENDLSSIEKDLSGIGSIEEREMTDFFQVTYQVQGVKISFYSRKEKSPVISPVHILNNIYAADIPSIAVMKMEVMLRRALFRDYYDLYSIFQERDDIMECIDIALKYSRHLLKSKQIMAILMNGSRFVKEKQFNTFLPKYNVNEKAIQSFFRELLSTTGSQVSQVKITDRMIADEQFHSNNVETRRSQCTHCLPPCTPEGDYSPTDWPSDDGLRG